MPSRRDAAMWYSETTAQRLGSKDDDAAVDPTVEFVVAPVDETLYLWGNK